MSSRAVFASTEQEGWIHNPGKLRVAVRSDVGMVRELNEDTAYVDAERGIFMVADGIGGLAGGEEASALAVDVVCRRLAAALPRLAELSGVSTRRRRAEICDLLGEAVRAAHRGVRRRAGATGARRGMGTTLDLVLVVENDAFIAHVGDTRTYLIREGHAAPVTRDHTVAQLMHVGGRISRDEVRASPLRSVLINAIGSQSEVSVDLSFVPIRAGDQLLMCSDGLYEYFTDDELAACVSWGDPDLGVRELVDMACARGGRDNVTAVLVDVVQGAPRRTEHDDVSSDAVPVAIDDGATQPYGEA